MAAATTDKNLKIGVLAKRGKKKCLEKWSATAYFLTSSLEGPLFSIIPLTFEEVIPEVREGKIDFVLVNSAIYIMLEKEFRVNRIATMKNVRSDHVLTKFGGVIFTRSINSEIKVIKDLKHKKFMAVNPVSFGGWYMGWRCLKTFGIDPHKDFRELQYGNTHDNVIYAVRDGIVDAGTVRSDTLERMAKEGKIRLSDFRVLKRGSSTENNEFPFLVTTRLYPEWPFAALPHVPIHLSEKISSALLRMEPEDDAAVKGNYAGWTIPLNYEAVAECLKVLNVPPYDNNKNVNLATFIKQHILSFILSGAFFILIILFSIYTVGLNRRLSANLKKIAEDQREKEYLHAKLLSAQKLESIGQLASGIAHEINTPVQYIISNLDFMKDAVSELQEPLSEIESIAAEIQKEQATSEIGKRIAQALEDGDWEYLSEELPKAIEQSKEGAQRVAGIVKAMKEFAHPGSHSMEVEDLNSIIETTITISKNEWKYVSDLEFEPDTSLPSVHCLKDAIGQTILNIIVNSAHAIESKIGKNPEDQKGKITISTLKRENMAEIRISDTGTGIPSNIINRIFDPFFTTKDVGKGSGQGLAISYDIIVNKHGGELNVESVPGEGTTFIISLPFELQEENNEMEVMNN